jgi:hypothetical protein
MTFLYIQRSGDQSRHRHFRVVLSGLDPQPSEYSTIKRFSTAYLRWPNLWIGENGLPRWRIEIINQNGIVTAGDGKETMEQGLVHPT